MWAEVPLQLLTIVGRQVCYDRQREFRKGGFSDFLVVPSASKSNPFFVSNSYGTVLAPNKIDLYSELTCRLACLHLIDRILELFAEFLNSLQSSVEVLS